ncbi:MAG: hypothetical protein Q8R55_07480 [Candidatus Taylorbacteria bacterium]|nr:hypothetical protein [Candidatus Taylorbacteria bacterium]
MKYRLEYRVGDHGVHHSRNNGTKLNLTIDKSDDETAVLVINQVIERIKVDTDNACEFDRFVRIDQEEKTTPINLDL